jgi:hypothetical protein
MEATAQLTSSYPPGILSARPEQTALGWCQEQFDTKFNDRSTALPNRPRHGIPGVATIDMGLKTAKAALACSSDHDNESHRQRA